MEMISHQTLTVHLPAGLAASLLQSNEKLLPIPVVQKNRPAPITAAHEVITSAGISTRNGRLDRYA